MDIILTSKILKICNKLINPECEQDSWVIIITVFSLFSRNLSTLSPNYAFLHTMNVHFTFHIVSCA